jgi:hypothetical protein
MRILRSLRFRARCLLRRSKAEAEMSNELEDYIEHQTERHIASGLSPEGARLAALRDAGGMEQVKRRVTWFSNVAQDLRYALRAFPRTPRFTALVVFMLALGMGANLST